NLAETARERGAGGGGENRKALSECEGLPAPLLTLKKSLSSKTYALLGEEEVMELGEDNEQ
ncbi:MAG: hypothetical protein AAGF26_18245, partial [Cyanobacteria bacterium P01_G01_bin.49]